jgi:hypothetical protein
MKHSAKKALTHRENNIVGPLFCVGLSLDGMFLGEDPVLDRRIGLDQDLRNGTLTQG